VELTEWMALQMVEAEEEQHRRDVAESEDGKVYEHNREDAVPDLDVEDEIGDGGE
jgi:hypothetical protein